MRRMLRKEVEQLGECGVPQIRLGNDLFWLTVPSLALWSDLVGMPGMSVENSSLLDPMFLSYHINSFGDIEYLALEKHRVSLRGRSNGQEKNPGTLMCYNVDLYFRPMLVPLDRDGKVDQQFEESNPDGTEIVGGFLRCVHTSECDLTLKNTAVYGGSPNQLDPLFLVRDEAMSLVEDGGLVTDRWEKDAEPLHWVVYDGCLICTKNVLKTSLLCLYEKGIVPRLPIK